MKSGENSPHSKRSAPLPESPGIALKTPLRNLHLLAGLLGIIVFLLTGYYVRFHIHHLMEADDQLRFSLRGNHIYILLSSLLNLCLGAYLQVSFVRRRALIQYVGSLMVFAATALVVAAFFFESKSSPERPLTRMAVYFVLAGAVLHPVSQVGEQKWKP